MFLERLERAEQLVFLSLAHKLVAADSVAAIGEVTRFAGLRREMGLGADTPLDALSLESAAQRIENRRSRKIVLLELMALGHADGRLSLVESGLIKRLADEWAVSTQDLRAMEGWVKRHREMVGEALALFSGAQTKD